MALTSSLPSVHVFPQSEVFKALIDVFTPVSKPSNCLAVLVLEKTGRTMCCNLLKKCSSESGVFGLVDADL